MNITNFKQTDFKNAYGILCSTLPRKNSRQGLYPTFCRIPQGGKTTIHSHFEPELFFVIEGAGRMKILQETSPVSSGDLIPVPPFATHELENLGTGDLTFLSVYSEDLEIPHLPSKVVVTAAPPTPNGPLHLGHISGPYLASDVLSRYLKLRSVKTITHSGFDDHQNYVHEKARALGQSTGDFRGQMHHRIQQSLTAMNVHFDEFIEPAGDAGYGLKVQDFFRRAREVGVIEREIIAFPFCANCEHFLIDAKIAGLCPICSQGSHGNCENCGITVMSSELLEARCARCETPVQKREVGVYTFSLSRFLPLIKEDLGRLPLAPRLKNLVHRVFIEKNLKVLITHPDREAVGISTPDEVGLDPGGDGQSLHVWFEMAAHYENFALQKASWAHSFGFDNGFYYLLFIPALLRAINPAAKLPDFLITNEFLLLEGSKFSTSRGHAIWADEFSGDVDHLRLFLSMHRPAGAPSNFQTKKFEIFSDELSTQLNYLKARARKLMTYTASSSDTDSILCCNRFTRDMEHFFSPGNLDLRSASRRLLHCLDQTLHSATSDGGEKLKIRALAVTMAPLMPRESGEILKILGHDECRWVTDWSMI